MGEKKENQRPRERAERKKSSTINCVNL